MENKNFVIIVLAVLGIFLLAQGNLFSIFDSWGGDEPWAMSDAKYTDQDVVILSNIRSNEGPLARRYNFFYPYNDDFFDNRTSEDFSNAECRVKITRIFNVEENTYHSISQNYVVGNAVKDRFGGSCYITTDKLTQDITWPSTVEEGDVHLSNANVIIDFSPETEVSEVTRFVIENEKCVERTFKSDSVPSDSYSSLSECEENLPIETDPEQPDDEIFTGFDQAIIDFFTNVWNQIMMAFGMR